MATAQWQQINMQASDGGLESCLTMAGVAPSLAKNIREVQKCVTLSDFASSFTSEDYKQLLDDIWQSDEDTKAVRVNRGRLHSAWKAAAMAIKRLEEGAPKTESTGSLSSDIAWEAPLSEDDYIRVWGDWTARYSVKLEAHLLPGDPLINRTFRELRKWQMPVTDVRKWKSVLLEGAPDEVVETKMGSRAKMVEGLITEFKPKDLLEYYWGLRVQTNAWDCAAITR